MNSGITTAGVLDYQPDDHPSERCKRCGTAVRYGTKGIEMGLSLLILTDVYTLSNLAVVDKYLKGDYMDKQDDVLGWASTAWGMTETEVLKLITNAKKFIPPAEFGNPPKLSTVGIPEITIGGRFCGIYFFFDNKARLEKVLINTSEENKTGYYEIFLEMLTQKYGRATTSYKEGIKDTVTWVFPKTIVELERIDASALDLPPFSTICYRPNISQDISFL